MPDLIRHPEQIEFTGFGVCPDAIRVRRNDNKVCFLRVYYKSPYLTSSIFLAKPLAVS